MIRFMVWVFADIMTAYWQWRIRRAGAVIPMLDRMMVKAGYNRAQRRQFWREFAGSVKVRAAAAEKEVGE
jgi:hypothetical protein